ncbi:MAG TPA: hypothetical protein VH951_07110, partial [Dehalococcoidia bacterium]
GRSLSASLSTPPASLTGHGRATRRAAGPQGGGAAGQITDAAWLGVLNAPPRRSTYDAPV